ncbi:ATP-binding protein [Pseudooceanicola sp. C21-150M6]|uniref:ATP-binding protein n=1 Tax=Pseudooceanicola sp. C21-150M6 TaxID=3434355 RepID=UPI003D7F2EC1
MFLILALATGAVWMSAALWIEHSTRAQVEHVLDARLAEAARMVSSLLTDHRIAVAAAGDAPVAVPLPEAEGYSRQLSCQIWSLDGALVGRSQGAPDTRLSDMATEGFSVSTVEGEPWRVFSVLNPEMGLRVMVGDSLAVRDRLVRDVIEGLLLPAAVMLPALALLIWFGLSRGLAPLDRMAESLRARSPQDLSPLPGPVPSEIRPVRQALNALMSRVGAARDAERDFTTFAAHELKTPLAGLRAQAQVLRMSDDPEVRGAAIENITRSVDRTDRMVRQLLELARIDRAERVGADCDPARIIEEVLQDLATLAQVRRVRFDVTADAGRTIVTDAFLLRTALRNVVENAVQASPDGATVRLSLSRDPLEITVSDTGPGIPDTLRDRATERFTRGPTGGPEGSGLGLAIVASAMERLDGSVQFDSGPGQTVRLRLPG